MELNGIKLPDNVFDLLEERGLIANVTDRDLVRDLLAKEKITFYIGFDPTADSLHVGHFLQLNIMRYSNFTATDLLLLSAAVPV